MTSMNKWEREIFEVAMINKATYERNIRERDEEYKIKNEDFLQWLEENNHMDFFKSQIERLRRGRIEFYDIAVDFSIPISMVKLFSKRMEA